MCTSVFMSTTLIPSLDTLPIELIYRIFDHLDGQFIVLSLCHVCQRLDNGIHRYFHQNGCKLNFDRIAKSDFIRVCHLIQPENVISLTLSDQCTTAGQISLFLSFFSIEQFTRLRSLALLNIADEHLTVILKHAVTCPLISLSIQEKDTSQRSTATNNLLSVTIEQPGLHNLTLSLMEDGRDQIKWPLSSTIQHLTLYHCHVKHFPVIFHHFASLRILFIRNCDLNDYPSLHPEPSLDLSPMHQLTSLVMEDIAISINKLVSILSNTSSLTHLRLIGSIDKIDFQWGKLIQEKLPLLSRFEFFFYTRIYVDNNPIIINTLIAPFRTPFWLEMKTWFVNCDQIKCFNIHDTTLNCDIQLYTIPVRNHYFQYYPDSYRITSSTSMDMNKQTAVMDGVRTVFLKSDMMMSTTMIQEAENTTHDLHTMQITPSTHLFRKVLNLKIRYDSTWSDDFVQRLSLLIDLSHLEKLILIDEFPQDFYPNTAISVTTLLRQASNIRSLILTATWLDETYISHMEYFCSLIPSRIKHLEIDIELLNDIKIILNRLEHLSSVTFRYFNGKEHWQTEIIEWLSERRDLTYSKEYDSLHIWLGKKRKSTTPRQLTAGIKRVRIDQY